MEKMILLRSIYRRACFRSSSRFSAFSRHQLRHHHFTASRTIFNLSSSPSIAAPSNRILSGFRYPCVMGVGSIKTYSVDVAHMPVFKDPEIENAFKDLMAACWDELPEIALVDAKKALSKKTDDKTGYEVLANVFRAAEAVEEFCGILVSLKMELDDGLGMSGMNVKPLPDEFVNALRTVYQRYTAYLDAFGPDEAYLRKKVENEVGTKMIHLKMRCGGLGSEWGKVTVLGTSGLAGSYVEQRA